MMPSLVNAPIDASMTLTPANDDAMAAPRMDVLFVLSCLAVLGAYCALDYGFYRANAVAQVNLDQGALPVGSTPAQFKALIDTDRARYGKIIVDKGIKLE
jgi:hypothetical protein